MNLPPQVVGCNYSFLYILRAPSGYGRDCRMLEVVNQALTSLKEDREMWLAHLVQRFKAWAIICSPSFTWRRQGLLLVVMPC